MINKSVMKLNKILPYLFIGPLLVLMKMAGEQRCKRWLLAPAVVKWVPLLQRRLLNKKNHYWQKNLARILPNDSPNQRSCRQQAMHRHMLSTAIEAIFIDSAKPNYTVNERSAVVQNSANGSIFVSAHIGNWYAVRQFLTAQGLAPIYLIRDYSQSSFDHSRINRAGRFGETLSTAQIPALMAAIKAGRNVLIMMDIKVKKGRNGARIDFCQQPAWTSTFAAEMALSFNKNLQAITARRTAQGTVIDVHPAIALEAQDKPQLTAAINEQLSQAILHEPEQWLLWDTNRWGP